MKIRHSAIGALLVFLAYLAYSCTNLGGADHIKSAKGEQVLESPPMGWNSWNSMGFQINEAQVMEIADYMADNLLDYGYNYLVIDAGWYYPEGFHANLGSKTLTPPQKIDQYGRLIPDEVKFPSSKNGNGLKSLAGYVHSKGLKFGIHIMRGLPWNAYESDTPVHNSDYTARQIARKDTLCEWNHSMLNLLDSLEGSYHYYKSLIELYHSWGVDFIKADDMSRPYHKGEIEMLSRAIQETDPDMLLSLSPGPSPLDEASHLGEQADMWRVSNDVWDSWDLVRRQFEYGRRWQHFEKSGSWPDLDMLPLGKLRVTGGDDWIAELLDAGSSSIKDEFTRLTEDEQYTVMNFWGIFRSPLMIGGYLPHNDSLTLRLLTNRELIELNQHSTGNIEIYYENILSVWKASSTSDSLVDYIAVFNLSDTLVMEGFEIDQFIEADNYTVVDVWNESPGQEPGAQPRIVLNPHQSVLFKIIINHKD